MKTLIIPRVELDTMSSQYQWVGDDRVNLHTKKRLIDAGFNMTRILYADRDEEGNRRYQQLEPGEEVAALG